MVADMKKREIFKILTLTIILLSALWMLNVQTSQASKTLTVPQDYPTIGEAVSHASPGDVVSVQAGVYTENLQINKSISIVGEDPKSTFIVGTGGGNHALAAITVATDNVKISGFTIESLNYSSANNYATGIIIQGDHCTITGNIIQNNYLGIFCSIQSYTQITENNITANLHDGMRFFGGSYNTVSENNITLNAVSGIALEGYSNTISKNNIQNNYRGIGFGSSYSVIFGNNVSSNTESGIFLAGSKNIVSANEFQANKWGIFITPQLAASHDNTFYHNNFVNNAFGAFDNSSSPVEFWDNGAKSGGNYWSDYLQRYPNASETASSGIGNTAYSVNSGNMDNYPLMAPYNTLNLGNPPAANPSPTAAPNSVVASWSFDSIDSNGVTADSTGKNPAVLGATNANNSYIPMQVDGKFGKALSFNGQYYVNVPNSPSLETPEQTTVDVWINAQSFKADVAYNNIIVECVRTTDALPTRTFGLAINGQAPQNASSPAIGALRAYVLTKDGGLNEIVTKSVVPLNQWIHLVFTRSLTTGMHIYVDGKEQEVYVTAGTANPQGAIMRQNEIYIGHDSICTIDELKVSNTVEQTAQPLWMQWWLWTAIIFAGVAVSGVMLFFRKQGKAALSKKSPPA
jgi:parallel beta-helix repeat protein